MSSTADAPALVIGNERATDPKTTVYVLTHYLAGLCDGAQQLDGVGFNRLHARFGHEMASKPIEEITDRQFYAMWKMLGTYKNTQLRAFWPLVTEMPNPANAPEEIRRRQEYDEWRRQREAGYVPQPYLRQLGLTTIGGHKFLELRQNYDPTLLAKIKELPDRFYDRATATWLVPLRLDALERIGDFLVAEGYETTPAVADAISAEIEAYSRIVDLSHAAEMDGLDVDVPEGLALYPFQKIGVHFIKAVGNTLVADQMGLGKTVQGAIGVREIAGFPLVVICPASLKENWKREIKKWLPDHSVGVLDTKLIAPTNRARRPASSARSCATKPTA
jgi:hypothetical protein